MQRSQVALELVIGETIQIGTMRLTVVDIENGEVCFHIEPSPDERPDPVDQERLLATV